MKTNSSTNVGTGYLAPTGAGREARLDEVAGSLEEQSLQLQSLDGEQLAQARTYGNAMCSDIDAVQGCGPAPFPQDQGYDGVAQVDQILAQLRASQSFFMAMMMMQQMMLLLQMMMEAMGGGGGQPGPGPVDGDGGAGPQDGGEGKPAEGEPMTPVGAARILAKYFDLLDTAAGKGKKDNVVETADLQAVAQNPDAPEELRRAADYVLKNPMVANALDVGNKKDKVDGRFGREDFESFIKQHEGEEGYDKDQDVESGPVDGKEKPVEGETPDEEEESPVDSDKPVDETKPVDLPNPNPDPADALAAQQDATALNEAMDGVGTDEEQLIKILSNRTNKQISLIKAAYTKSFNRDLTEAVTSETSGHFREVLLALLAGKREEGGKVDPNRVQDDAQAIHQAGGPLGFNTDDDKLISIFTTRSKEHLKEVARVFEHVHGKSLRSFVEEQTSGDYEDALLAQLPA